MTAQKEPTGWHLGLTSSFRESGGNGPGTISLGQNDPGGVSYGTYQLSTKRGTLNEYLRQSPYWDDFKRLTPTTPAFDAKWRELANTDLGFGQDQHNFIKRTHYDVEVTALKKDGLDLSSRGPAVQDAIWSTSVQMRGMTPAVFEGGLKEKFGNDYKLSALTDRDIVEAVQDYKVAHNASLFKSTPKRVWPSLISRALAEKIDLLALADGKLPTHLLNPHIHHAVSLKVGSHGQDVRHADPATQRTMQIDLQPLQLENSGLMPGVSYLSAATPGLNDPRNAANSNHALYNELKGRIPEASEPRLLQFTAACHSNRITEQNLGAIHFNRQDGLIGFVSTGLTSSVAIVDVKQPSPPPAQSIQQIQHYDQHQAQFSAQIAQTNAHAQHGPVMGAPGH